MASSWVDSSAFHGRQANVGCQTPDFLAELCGRGGCRQQGPREGARIHHRMPQTPGDHDTPRCHNPWFGHPWVSQPPGTRFSKAPETFGARKALAKSRTLRLQSCSMHVFLIWTEVPFIQEVSGVYSSPFLDTDELKFSLRARNVSEAFEKRALGADTLGCPRSKARSGAGRACAWRWRRYTAVHGWRHFYSLGKQSLVWKFSRMRGEIIGFIIIKQIKKLRLCTVLL